MANYKELHGFEIKHRSSDPPSPIEGEIWSAQWDFSTSHKYT